MIDLLLLGLGLALVVLGARERDDAPLFPDERAMSLAFLPRGSTTRGSVFDLDAAPDADAAVVVVLEAPESTGNDPAPTSDRLIPALQTEGASAHVVALYGTSTTELRAAVNYISDKYARRVVLVGADREARKAMEIGSAELGAVHTVIAVTPRRDAVPPEYLADRAVAPHLVVLGTHAQRVTLEAAGVAVVDDASPQSQAMLAIAAGELTA